MAKHLLHYFFKVTVNYRFKKIITFESDLRSQSYNDSHIFTKTSN